MLESILNGIDKIKTLIRDKTPDIEIFRDILKEDSENLEIRALAQKTGQLLAKAENALSILQERARVFQMSKTREILRENVELQGKAHKILTKVKNSLNDEILKSYDVWKDKVNSKNHEFSGELGEKETEENDVTEDEKIVENKGKKQKVGVLKDHAQLGKRSQRTRAQILEIWKEKIRVNRVNPAFHSRESLCMACGLFKSEVDNMGKAEREVVMGIVQSAKMSAKGNE
jgi:hypothetical protein